MDLVDILRLELLEVGLARLRLTVKPSVFNQARSLTMGSPKGGGTVKLARSSGERPWQLTPWKERMSTFGPFFSLEGTMFRQCFTMLTF